MSYKLIVSLFLLFLMISCSVKNSSENNASPEFSTSYYTSNIYYTNHYDSNDRLSKVEIESKSRVFDEESKLKKEEIYLYDVTGKLTEKRIYLLNDHDSDREIISINKYTDNMEQYIVFEGNDTISFLSTEFDERRNIIKQISFNYDIDFFTGKKDLMEYYITYNLYDDLNRIIRKKVHNRLTNHENSTEYLYTTSKDTIIQILKENDSKPSRFIKSFNHTGNKKYKLHFDGDNYLLAHEEEWLNGEDLYVEIFHKFEGGTFMYDTTWYDNNREVKFISDSNMLKVKTEKKYDEKGNILEENTIMVPGE